MSPVAVLVLEFELLWDTSKLEQLEAVAPPAVCELPPDELLAELAALAAAESPPSPDVEIASSSAEVATASPPLALLNPS